MRLFDIAAVLIALAAALGYLNHRWLKFPPTIGITAMALAGSLIMVGLDRVAPGWHMRAQVDRFLGQINFTSAVLHGMLCFLLFAGALHVGWDELKADAWTVGILSTVGVAISVILVAGATAACAGLLHLCVRAVDCFLFGALISPTDPIAVIGLLKGLHAPKALEAKIAGESLFNDGIGVVAFFACLSWGGFAPAEGEPNLVWFFLRQVLGGAVLGGGLGYLAFRALRTLDDAPLELLITVALVMFVYSVSFWLGVSGPIAVVVAGLLIGHAGRKYAMSQTTRGYIEAFWSMIDEILNALLFLLLGLEALSVHWGRLTLLASLLAIPAVLLARLISVGVPMGVIQGRAKRQRGLVPILTWGGLRGGLSIAMVLSIPPFEGKNLLLGATYAVVVFSILVQGLTMPRLCRHYGL